LATLSACRWSPPATCICICARAAGCKVLLVSYGYSEGRDVRSLDADGVVATLGEAADRLLD